MERRYDIDWLRVIAIGLLLIYHIAIAFQPWGLMIGFIQSKESLTWLWPAMSLLNVWRIPLLFYVSGMGVFFAMRKRTWKALITERTMRIWLPFVVGMLAVVPLHMLLLQGHYGMKFQYQPHPGHLWFLANIFSYVLILSPLFYFLKRKENTAVHLSMQRFFGSPVGLLVVMLAFVAEALFVDPAVFEMYVLTWHGYLLGLLAFLSGFGFVYAGQAFVKNLDRWKWLWFVLAVGLYAVRLIYFQMKAPNYLLSIESNCWIFSALAFGQAYLQKPGKALTYLSEAAYPVYIWHMAWLYLGSVLIFPIGIAAWIKFLLLVLFTFAGCFGTFELLKRTKVSRLLFGMKVSRTTKPTADGPLQESPVVA